MFQQIHAFCIGAALLSKTTKTTKQTLFRKNVKSKIEWELQIDSPSNVYQYVKSQLNGVENTIQYRIRRLLVGNSKNKIKSWNAIGGFRFAINSDLCLLFHSSENTDVFVYSL